MSVAGEAISDEGLGETYDLVAQRLNSGLTWATLTRDQRNTEILMRALLRHHLAVWGIPDPNDLASATADATFRFGYRNHSWDSGGGPYLQARNVKLGFVELATELVAAAEEVWLS